MYKALKIITAALFLLPLGPYGCGGDDGGCKVDFDCPGSQVCVESKCQPLVCTSNAACIDPSLVCQSNECVPANPDPIEDNGSSLVDEGSPADSEISDDPGLTPEDEGTNQEDTAVAVDTPSVEDTAVEDASQPEDQSTPEDQPAVEDTQGPEDVPVADDEGEGPDDDGPGDEGPEGDEGFDQCGGVTPAGCCSDNKATVCTAGGLNEIDCSANGTLCGWGPIGFYACGTDGLADPEGTHPYACPGESCEGSCDGKNCGTDGCGNSCGVCEGGTTCDEGSGICEEDEPIEEAPTYFQDVQPILMQYCSGCHTGGGSGGHNIASNYVDSFKSSGSCPGLMVGPCSLERMQNGTMPPGPADILQFELDIMEEWVNAGMPQGPAP